MTLDLGTHAIRRVAPLIPQFLASATLLKEIALKQVLQVWSALNLFHFYLLNRYLRCIDCAVKDHQRLPEEITSALLLLTEQFREPRRHNQAKLLCYPMQGLLDDRHS